MVKQYVKSEIYKKQLQKYPQSTPPIILKLCIVELLKEGKTISNICATLNLSMSALSYYLSSLKNDKIITKVGYGTWRVLDETTSKIVQQMPTGTTSKVGVVDVITTIDKYPKRETRGHGFQIKFLLPKNLKNWNKRGDILKTHFKELHPQPLNEGKGWKIMYKGHKVHLWDKCIVIYCSLSFLSAKAKDAKSTALEHFLSIIKGLERKFNSPDQFKFRGRYSFSFSKEHYALVRNIMARQYTQDGDKLEVSNQYGVWAVMDKSLHMDELEFHKNKSPDTEDAVKNTEGMQTFLNQLKEYNWEFQPKAVMGMIGTTAKNVEYYSENVVKHVGIMERIGEGLARMDARDERSTQAIEKIAVMLEKLNEKMEKKDE